MSFRPDRRHTAMSQETPAPHLTHDESAFAALAATTFHPSLFPAFGLPMTL